MTTLQNISEGFVVYNKVGLLYIFIFSASHSNILSFIATVPITTNIVSSNPAHREVYLIQHYVIKFVNDLR
jgi:hypothetical protein